MSIRKFKKEYSYEDLINYFVFEDPENGDKIMKFCFYHTMIETYLSYDLVEQYAFEYCSKKYNLHIPFNEFDEAVNKLIEAYKVCEEANKSLIRKIFKDLMEYSYDLDKFSSIKNICKGSLNELKEKLDFNYTDEILLEVSTNCQKYFNSVIYGFINDNFNIRDI